MRCHWPDIHLLHPQPFQQSLASHGDSDEENADNDAERALVRTSVEWDAVGGRGVGVWGCGGRRLDAKEREAGKGEVKKGKRALILNFLCHFAGYEPAPHVWSTDRYDTIYRPNRRIGGDALRQNVPEISPI